MGVGLRHPLPVPGTNRSCVHGSHREQMERSWLARTSAAQAGSTVSGECEGKPIVGVQFTRGSMPSNWSSIVSGRGLQPPGAALQGIPVSLFPLIPNPEGQTVESRG